MLRFAKLRFCFLSWHGSLIWGSINRLILYRIHRTQTCLRESNYKSKSNCNQYNILSCLREEKITDINWLLYRAKRSVSTYSASSYDESLERIVGTIFSDLRFLQSKIWNYDYWRTPFLHYQNICIFCIYKSYTQTTSSTQTLPKHW